MPGKVHDLGVGGNRTVLCYSPEGNQSHAFRKPRHSPLPVGALPGGRAERYENTQRNSYIMKDKVPIQLLA